MVNYKYIITAITIFVITLSCFISQVFGGAIEGRVFNRHSKQPIPNVNVTILGTHIGAATDSSGSFALINLSDGQYTLHFTYIGFREQKRDVTVRSDGKIKLDVQLSPTILHQGKAVVTTTRGLRDRFECPMATEVVNRSVLEHRNTMSMADAFDQLPGVSISTTGKGSIRPVIRGLYDTHVLILLNGIPMNDLRPGGNHVMLIEPEQVERMEIVRGPGSVLYGSDAIGGLVNFITMPRNPFFGEKLDHIWKLQSGYCSNGDLYRIGAEVGVGTKERFVKGRYGLKESRNIKDPNREIPNSGYEGNHIDLMGGWRNDLVDLDLVYHYLIADVGVPINPAIRHSVFEDEKQQFLKLSGTLKPSVRSLLTVETNLSWQRHNRHFHMLKPFVFNPDTLEQDMQIFVNTDAWNFQVIPTTLLSERSVLKYGIDLLYQTADSDRRSFTTDLFSGQQNIITTPRVIPNSRHSDLAFFLQSETNWRDFSLFASVRHDRVHAKSDETDRSSIPLSEMDEQAFSGNLGLVCHLKRGINLTGQIGRAFRSPTLLELYFWGPHQMTVDRGNPDLEPETSLNLDLGLNQRKERFEWSINGFHNTIQDYIYKRQTGDIDSASGLLIDSWENMGDVRLIGGEIQGVVYLWERIGVFSNLSYVEATDLDNDKPVPDIPPLNGNLNLRYSAPVISGELGANFAAKQNRLASNEKETSAHVVYNGSVEINLERWLKVPSKLNLTVTNILDTKYHNHLSRIRRWYFEPGRNISLALTLEK
ncbi:MAG: TonB-dependent receptor [Candidatus Hatepunaea meridiana]|nr:TonB-dependent receptor [Candidatus Hatepunaea meridiana]